MNVRARSVVVVVVVALAGVAWWWFGRERASRAPPVGAGAPIASGALNGLGARVGRDPRTLERASIAGTIRGPAGRPIAHARVCVDASSLELADELTRDPRCADSGERGTYAIGELYVAHYTIVAMARGFVPAAYQLAADREPTQVALAAGQHAVGIDVTLAPGGAELTGVVNDVSGGPVAHAHVRANSGDWGSGHPPLELPMIESESDGTFTMWVRAGDVSVSATADGYAPGSESGRAPGKVEILLTPESSLAGTVVDARTGEPVAGARVELDGDAAPASTGELTDDHGAFHVTGLPPGRYAAIARAPHGYGRSVGTVQVGLGQHVTGVVVKLYPAQRVAGIVRLAGGAPAPCKRPMLELHDPSTARRASSVGEGGGAVHADGVLAGTYDVTIGCDGALAHAKYDAIKVADHDVTGVIWEVDAGETITGRVTTASGTAVDGAVVTAHLTGGDPRAPQDWATASASADGAFTLTGLRAGSHQLDVRSDRGVPPHDGWLVEVTAGMVAHRDLVLGAAGTIKGAVVDASGAGVGGIQVAADPLSENRGGNQTRSRDDGSFELDTVWPGDYRVTARRDWNDELRAPGTQDDAKQGQRVTVTPGGTTSAHLVVELRTGVIHGVVVDAAGKPVGDAFVSAARESDRAGSQASAVEQTRWGDDHRPVLTGIDGTFAITGLSAGTYSVRADRKGGGEAIAEHVAVGATARLQIRQTGSLDGTARRDGGEPDDLVVNITDPTTGYDRHERFFRTAGHYTLAELPAGHFTLTFAAEGDHKQLEVDLGDGEAKTGVDVAFDPVLAVTGRVVDAVTGAPVADVSMMLGMGADLENMMLDVDERSDHANVSDAAGRFTIARAPRGQATLLGIPNEDAPGGSGYGMLISVRTLGGDGSSCDVGDLAISKSRLKPGDKAGELGVHWAEHPPGTPLDKRQLTVAWIDPAGPAAASGLVVGDVVTAVDGQVASGADFAAARAAFDAPPGTAVELALKRGATVTIVLAQP